MENTKRKRGFTLVELITVIAMLLLLIGAVTSSVAGARKRAKIQQAISEAQELTNAILAYENFSLPGKPSPLADKETKQRWKEASDTELAFVLGQESMPNGRDGNVPVLFNGSVRGGMLRDPWGKPYWFRIMSSPVDTKVNSLNVSDSAAFAIPNINRIPADED